MVSSPLFSVIMVTLNCAESAVYTAQSVFAQGCDEVEYIVKDGGSTDGTVERLQELGVAVSVSADSGIYDAMNQALALATGEYVCFMNAGDRFPTADVLKQVADQIRRHNAPDFLYGNVRSFTTHPLLQGEAQVQEREIAYPARINRFYLFRKMICHQVWFVRRELYQVHNGFDLRYALGADYAFLMKTIARGDVRYAHVPMVVAEYSGGGLSERRRIERDRDHATIKRWAFSPLERTIYGLIYSSGRLLFHKLIYRWLVPHLRSSARSRLYGS